MSPWLHELSCYRGRCCPIILFWCFLYYSSCRVIEIHVVLSFMFDVSLVTWVGLLKRFVLSCYLCLMSRWLLMLSCYRDKCCPAIRAWCLLGHLIGLVTETDVVLSFMFDVSLVTWVGLLKRFVLSCYLCLMSRWLLVLSCYKGKCCPAIPVWCLLGYTSCFVIEVDVVLSLFWCLLAYSSCRVIDIHVVLSFMFDVSLVTWVVLL